MLARIWSDNACLPTGDPRRVEAMTRVLGAGLPLSVLQLNDHDIPNVFALLPLSLTALQLHTSSRQQAAAVPQLSSLVQLDLRHVAVRASLLRSFPALRQLKLYKVQVLCTDDDAAVAAAATPRPHSLLELELQSMEVQLTFLRCFLNLQPACAEGSAPAAGRRRAAARGSSKPC